MSSKDDASEDALLSRKGPTHGISFTRDQADQLVRQYLNMTIKSFEYKDLGYNNLLFFIDTNESSQRYALKIGGRYWISIKTEAEVKALLLLAQHTSIPVPHVLAYSSDRQNEFGVEWILMTRLPGESMTDVCEKQSLGLNSLRPIIEDLANFVSQMHSNIPRMQQIGAFRSNGQIGTDIDGRGPWSTYEEFVRGRARSAIKVLQEDPVFQPIQQTVLQAIEEFQHLPLPSFTNLPFVFTHGDLDIQNILLSFDDPDTPRITGIVDWEWAGSFPCSEEYFTSFSYFREHEDAAVRELFFNEFERRHILTPRTIENYSCIEKINCFLDNLAPWDLTDLNDPDDPIVAQRLEKSCATVLKILTELKTNRI